MVKINTTEKPTQVVKKRELPKELTDIMDNIAMHIMNKRLYDMGVIPEILFEKAEIRIDELTKT